MSRKLGTLLVIVGALLVADAVLTVVWKEPLTALRGAAAQRDLRRELDEISLPAPAATTRPRPGDRTLIRRDARGARASLGDARPLGELRIPAIGLDTVALTSSRPQDLRRGPGLIAGTSFPGLGATTAIAGHRTTYGAPFRRLDDVQRGDPITLRTPYATFTYAVEGRRIVDPDDLWVLGRIGRERLVLSACHPLYSAAHRIIVFARLVSVRRSASVLHTGA